MIDLQYILILAVGGAVCGLAGLIGDTCAITRRAVYASVLQGILFGTFVAMAIDFYMGTKLSGIAISVGGLFAILRMKLIIPLCNIVLKAFYDILFALIQHFNKK